MTTDKKMKKNSSGFTEKAYCLKRNFTWPTVHQLYQQKKVHEVSKGGLSANKNIEAV